MRAIGNTPDHLVSRFGHRQELILPLVTTLFLAGGACLDSCGQAGDFEDCRSADKRSGNGVSKWQ